MCPCDEVCGQAGVGEMELRQTGPGAGLGRSQQQWTVGEAVLDSPWGDGGYAEVVAEVVQVIYCVTSLLY